MPTLDLLTLRHFRGVALTVWSLRYHPDCAPQPDEPCWLPGSRKEA